MSRPRQQYSLRKHRYRDENTGRAKESLKWNIYFRDHLQSERKVTGTPDKSTSEYIARNITAIVNLKASNHPLTAELRDFIESQPQKLRDNLLKWDIFDGNTYAGFEPLMISTQIKAKNSRRLKLDVTGGHVYLWRLNMEANNLSPDHVTQAIAKVAKVIKGCGFVVPSDINGEKIKNYMASLQGNGSSSRTGNSYLSSFKAFSNWMLKSGRITQNPVKYLSPVQETEPSRKRRALTNDEVNALVTTTAAKGKKHHGLTGYERSLIYKIAIYTGLRWNEIATLQRKDFDLASKHPTVTVQGKNAKNKKTESVPLQSELAAEMTAYFKQHLAMPNTKAFLGIWQGESGAMIGEDLTLAKVERKTDKGHADFHALRHTYGTNLAKAGRTPQESQKLMRHSSIDLTMKFYTHLEVADLSEAVNSLPKVEAKKIKTGTMDTPEDLTANLTENLGKTQQNRVKSSKQETAKTTDNQIVTPCDKTNKRKAGERIRTVDVQLGKLRGYRYNCLPVKYLRLM
jgi:site-specific recombinase XerC